MLLSTVLCILGNNLLVAQDAISSARMTLLARDWRLREVAFWKLRAVKSQEARKELIDLLDRENNLTDEVYRGGGGVEDKYGEEYVSYKDDLTEVVKQNFTNFPDKGALKVLVHSAYNPDSIFAKWLSMQGPPLLPLTREMLGSDIYPDRESAVAVVAHLLSNYSLKKVRLSKQQEEEAHQQLWLAARNSDMWTRQVAVQYLAKVGTLSDVGVLKNVSEQDPGFDQRSSTYPVRDAARKALEEVRARSQK